MFYPHFDFPIRYAGFVFRGLVWTSKKVWPLFRKKKQVSLIALATPADVRNYGYPRIGDAKRAQTLISGIINNKHTTLILFMLLTTSIILLQVGHLPTTTSPDISTPITAPDVGVSSQAAPWPEGTFTFTVTSPHITGIDPTAVPATTARLACIITGRNFNSAQLEVFNWSAPGSPGAGGAPVTFAMSGGSIAVPTSNTVTLTLRNGDGTAHATVDLIVGGGHVTVTNISLQPGEVDGVTRAVPGKK